MLAEDCIYALGKAHTRFAPSLTSQQLARLSVLAEDCIYAFGKQLARLSVLAEDCTYAFEKQLARLSVLAEDCLYALGKAHTRSAPSPTSQSATSPVVHRSCSGSGQLSVTQGRGCIFVQRHLHCTLRGSELTVWQGGNELWATICKIYGIFQRPCPLHCKQISPADYVCSLLSRLWGAGGPVVNAACVACGDSRFEQQWLLPTAL